MYYVSAVMQLYNASVKKGEKNADRKIQLSISLGN